MTRLRRVGDGGDVSKEGLCRLLIETTDGGASVGFLAPMRMEVAERYWDGVLESIGPGLSLWVVEDAGTIVGSVQLAPSPKENATHRGEVQKLFVLPAWRGRGIASMLMRELESFARASGRTLLVLDTEADSAAEAIYRHLGWTFYGGVPEFAENPHGGLRANACYYKSL
ncbi:MAG: GNAT family N-acetyltransferase [Casimicrobiaceae bacterium]